MPFGLANAPSHFQSIVNTVFRDVIGVFVVIYLDDFLIFSRSMEEHQDHVRVILQRLRENRFFAKLSKCQFHTTTCEFLGYVITPEGIKMDANKVKTITNWPLPKSIHDIQKFLGFANFYRRFIPNFSSISQPLTDLVKPKERFKKFDLPSSAVTAFHTLLEAFTSANVLRHFDYHLPTRLETDASDFAVAAVVKQQFEGRWHPVAFYSRKMNPAERNYEIHDKELLAVVAALGQWRHMLAGLPQKFVILTDHDALRYFQTQRRITGRQARWALLLADFDFVIQYRPGTQGGEPDSLTRRVDMVPTGEEDTNFNNRALINPSAFIGVTLRSDHMPSPPTSPPTPAESSSAPPASRATHLSDAPTMEEISRLDLTSLCRMFQPTDDDFQQHRQRRPQPFTLRDGLWYCNDRLVIPLVSQSGAPQRRAYPTIPKEHLRFMVMTQCHDGISAGHPGRDATIIGKRWTPGLPTMWPAVQRAPGLRLHATAPMVFCGHSPPRTGRGVPFLWTLSKASRPPVATILSSWW